MVPLHEQDRLADYLLKLFAEDDAKWETAFKQSEDKLSKLSASIGSLSYWPNDYPSR
jgi:hypothetical protein